MIVQLPRYQYKTNNSFLDYEFISEGPKGRIKKIIRFTQISTTVFNIGFGDLDEETGEISDVAITNNNDSRKVLATVAATIHDFTIQYHNAWVVAKGSHLQEQDFTELVLPIIGKKLVLTLKCLD